jgi:hypothetical protein
MAMYACDVRQDVKTAEVIHGRGERGIEGIAIANISPQECCSSRAPAIRGFYGLDAEHFIHVERVYTGSLRDVRVHYRLSNALRASSDDDAFSNEFHELSI